MKCISLLEPWASLMMVGPPLGKSIETRGWDTRFRGQVGIHASSRWRDSDKALCEQSPFKEALASLGYHSWRDLPLASVLGTVVLVRTYQFDGKRPAYPECEFGDYTPGRFGLVCNKHRPFIRPVPAKGALSLWDWTPPTGLAYADGTPVTAGDTVVVAPPPAAPAAPRKEPSLFE